MDDNNLDISQVIGLIVAVIHSSPGLIHLQETTEARIHHIALVLSSQVQIKSVRAVMNRQTQTRLDAFDLLQSLALLASGDAPDLVKG